MDGFEKLLKELQASKTYTTTQIRTVQDYAFGLSQRTCSAYFRLNSVITRYETLIRNRWQKKTVQQRGEILLKACPTMPLEHGANIVYRQELSLHTWERGPDPNSVQEISYGHTSKWRT